MSGKALAQAVNVASSTAKHTVGEEYHDGANGKRYIYCQNTAGVAAVKGDVMGYSYGFTAEPGTAVIANRASTIGFGVALVNVPVSEYFWLQTGGAVAAITAGKSAYKENGWGVDVTAGRLVNSLGAATGGGLGRLAGIFVNTTCYTMGATIGGTLVYPVRTIRMGGEV